MKWYIYRLMPQTDGDLYSLDRQAGFSSHQAALDWIFKSGDQVHRLDQTFLFRRFSGIPEPVISLNVEAKTGVVQ